MPLSEHERRVLAELEAELGQLNVARHRRRSVIARVVVIVIPLAVLAAGLVVLAVVTLPAAGAAAVAGVLGVVAGAMATTVLLRWRRRRS
jgi:hypothetical protein